MKARVCWNITTYDIWRYGLNRLLCDKKAAGMATHAKDNMERFLRGFTEDCDALKKTWMQKEHEAYDSDELVDALQGVINSYQDNLQEVKIKEAQLRVKIAEDSHTAVILATSRDKIEKKLERLRERMKDFEE